MRQALLPLDGDAAGDAVPMAGRSERALAIDPKAGDLGLLARPRFAVRSPEFLHLLETRDEFRA